MAFRFSFLDVEAFGAYTHSITDMRAMTEFKAIKTWQEFTALRDSARDGAIVNGFTCTNKKLDNGKVDFTAKGRCAATYPPHEWANTIFGELREHNNSLAKKNQKPKSGWLSVKDQEGWETLKDQADACKVEPLDVYNLVQAWAFGCPPAQLFDALTAPDPAAGIKSLFNREFGAFSAFAKKDSVKWSHNKITMPAFRELAEAAASATGDVAPIVYCREDFTAAAKLSRPILKAKRKRSDDDA